MSPTDLAYQQEAFATEVAQSEKAVRELKQEEDTLIRARSDVESRVGEVRGHIEIAQAERETLESDVYKYEDVGARISMGEALDLPHIVESRSWTVNRVETLEELTRRALRLERAVDAAQRSALVTELQHRIQGLEVEKQAVSEKAIRTSAARIWSSQVSDVLKSKNSDAVEKHVAAFGPLTTLIQKRLRPVYGFGDIRLVPKGSSISVDVEWESERLKPTDYFSDSQAQILMFSLFLAGRLTQTWSGFAPILLDDPVTHFDDLNAFAFVELIRGLVSTSPGKRQFFVSTCEARLFELMRKKFNKTDAIFYCFETMGMNGPLVRKLGH